VRNDLKLAGGRGRTSYEKRARLAETLRPQVAERADDLGRLQMASGGTVGERVSAWLAESAIIDALLTERADLAAANKDGADVAKTARSLLRHMRTTLADERLLNPALPKNLDARVFGRLDALAKKAARRTAAAEPAAAESAPTT
jgi:hypothetical protein